MILLILSRHHLQDRSKVDQQHRGDGQDPQQEKEDRQAAVP